MPAKKKSTSVRRTSSNKKLKFKSSRISRQNFVIFVFIIAVIGAFIIWRSFAATGFILTANDLDKTSSVGASVVTETRNVSKRNSNVVEVDNTAAANGQVVLASANKLLGAGNYQACVNALATSVTVSGIIQAKIDANGSLGSSLGLGGYSLSPATDYTAGNCISFTVQSANTEVALVITNATANSGLRVGSVAIKQTGTLPPPPPPPSGIWQPTANAPLPLHWVLEAALNTSDPVQMGLRDFSGKTLTAPAVYDIDGEYNSKATVDFLHSQGKKVICYFDAGVYETYRSDASKFPKSVIGSADAGWAGSYWLDIRQVSVLAPIMQARMQMCKDKGFDAIEPDEITNWSNNPGFPITYQDQIVYNKDIAQWAHNIGMSIGLKGDLEQAHDLVNSFDWTLNEECFKYQECSTITNEGGPGADGKDYPGLQLFSQQNKAVWVAEYREDYGGKLPATFGGGTGSMCTTSAQQYWNTAFYVLGLPNSGGRQPCTLGW